MCLPLCCSVSDDNSSHFNGAHRVSDSHAPARTSAGAAVQAEAQGGGSGSGGETEGGEVGGAASGIRQRVLLLLIATLHNRGFGPWVHANKWRQP